MGVIIFVEIERERERFKTFCANVLFLLLLRWRGPGDLKAIEIRGVQCYKNRCIGTINLRLGFDAWFGPLLPEWDTKLNRSEEPGQLAWCIFVKKKRPFFIEKFSRNLRCPGVVVTYMRRHVFKSLWVRTPLVDTISHLFAVNFIDVCTEFPKWNEKEAGMAHLKQCFMLSVSLEGNSAERAIASKAN